MKRDKQISYLDELKSQKQQVEEALFDVNKAFSEVHDDYTGHLKSINAHKDILEKLKLEKTNKEKRIVEQQQRKSIKSEQESIQAQIEAIRKNNQLLLSQLDSKENALKSSSQLREELVNEYEAPTLEDSLILKLIN